MEMKPRTFVVSDTAYGDMIKELSQIVKKSYIVTFKRFETLDPTQVASILEDSLKWNSNGFKNRGMAVWTLRKKALGIPLSNEKHTPNT